MKKLIVIFVLLCGFAPVFGVVDGYQQREQHMSREEFRAKQKAFIVEQAKLTKEEAARFFPVYNELQEEKKKLNDDSWNLMRKGRDENTSEAQYEEIIERVCDNRIASDRLEKSYLDKFKKILSCKKIYLVQRAELRFHREFLKKMNQD